MAYICAQKEESRPRALELYAKLRALISQDEGAKEVPEGEIPDPDIQIEMSQLLESVNPKLALHGM